MKIEDEGGVVATDSVDIAEPAHARGLIARALARFGVIDVLVNNAGFVSAGDLSAQRDVELQRQFGTHVIGPVALVREALDALRASHGIVFMLGSGVARVPVGALGAYPAAKAAVRSATSILRRELRPQGIAVTYVDPGAVDTPFMSRAGMPGAPARLLVAPEEVARKILLAVATRPRTLDAVRWQTAAVALAELFPLATDFILERAPALIGGGSDAPALAKIAEPLAINVAMNAGDDRASEPSLPSAHDANRLISLAETLAPHTRRMEKLKLSEPFVRGLLVPGEMLELNDVGMRWAGMPNKHERARTEDVLDALAIAGFLSREEPGRFRVVRASDEVR